MITGEGPVHVLHSGDSAPIAVLSGVQEDTTLRVGAIFGLGLAYAGKQREEVGEVLAPLVTDESVPMEVVAYAALALGLVYVGSCHQNSVEAILQVCPACLACAPASSCPGAARLLFCTKSPFASSNSRTPAQQVLKVPWSIHRQDPMRGSGKR